MAFPTSAECKVYSEGIPEVVNATNDSLASKIIEAKRLIHNFCCQEFDVNMEATTKYFNGNDSDTLQIYPRCYSLDSVIDSTYNMTDLLNLKYGNNFSKLEALYPIYGLGPRYRVREGIGPYSKMFVMGSNNIEITGDWGWASVPDDVKIACMMIVEKLMIKKLDVRQWATPFETESMPGGYSYSKGNFKTGGGFLRMIFDEEILMMLLPYQWSQLGVYKV